MEPEDLSAASSFSILPGDTLTFNALNEPWNLSYRIVVPVRSATGEFNEVIVFRAFTPTPDRKGKGPK
jgi:hypothetical protein